MDILIVLPAVVLAIVLLIMVANYSGENFMQAFYELQKKAGNGTITAVEFARDVIEDDFDSEVELMRTERMLGDAYNPKKYAIILSNETINNTSSVALAIAAHELGHAQQHRDIPKKFYRFLRAKTFSAQLSSLIVPLIVLGVILMATLPNIWIGAGTAIAGGAIFLLCLFVRLATIPIEKDASKRGIKLMEKYTDFNAKELRLAKKLLRLALLTYIGDILRVMLMWTGLVKKTRL